MEGIDGILFDLGGTLDGPGRPWVDRFVAAYREAGVEVPAERLRDACHAGTRAAYAEPSLAVPTTLPGAPVALPAGTFQLIVVLPETSTRPSTVGDS